MEKFRIIEASVFLSMILFMIILVIRSKQKERSIMTRIFLLLCWSTIFVLFVDMGAWLTDGIDGENRWWLPYAANYALFILQSMPLIIWVNYVDYQLNRSLSRLKKRWYYAQPLILTVILMIYSAFSGYVFTIDAANRYQRGPGTIFITIIYIVVICFSFLLAFKHRRTADRRFLSVVAIFGIIPLAASIFQMLFYGMTLIWPSVGVAVIYAYIFLETQREIRDYLTGLLSRQQMDALILARIRDHGRKGDFGLIMIDMDDFKTINDVHGHSEGDEALIQLASILMVSTKTIDKTSRFGGDEFLILVENGNSMKIEEIIQRIHSRIDEVNHKKGKPYAIAISAGYAVFSPDVYRGFSDLMDDVDRKMYEVKKKRKAG